MKKWILHILLFASLFGMLTTSCSQDEEIADIPSAGTPSEKVTIRFTLDLGEQGGMRSRSSWEGYDEDDKSDSDQAEPGIGNENYIDTNSLQVFMFKTNGTYIGGLKDMVAKRQGDSNIYNIKGEVDVDKSAIVNEVLNCKIMVVANANATTVNNGQVTGYNNDAIFNHNVTSIPMWGIGTYTINLIQQLQVDLAEPIYMLRSMAKIEVTLNQAVYDEGYRITSATLNKYNTQGYVVPTLPLTTGDSPVVDWNNLTNTTSLSTANVFRENESLAVTASSPTSKSFSANVAGKSYVIYVPEYDNDGTMNIILGLENNGKDITTAVKSNIIKLNTYSDGKATTTPVDIVRNHCYQYTIRTINDGIEATLKVKVNDWNTDEETWNYKEQPSVTENDKMGWENASVSGTEVYVPYATTDNPAICNFRISTPVGATWYATFEEQKGVYNAFKFLDSDNNEVTMMSGNVGEPAELRIITTDTTPEVESTAVLRIAVRTKDERTIIVKKLVNGSDDAEFTLVQSIQ